MTWLAVAGIVVFFLGLVASIGLHEFGHMIPAKLFGCRVPQWMVGFGPTIWSRHKGETEYGIKWIPLGGYCRIIGMLPPGKEDAEGRIRASSTGPFQSMIASARGAAMEELRPGDENRVFYRKKWWQKLIIMVGGPAVNLLLAVLFFGIVFMGFGVPTAQQEVAVTNDCVISAAEERTNCQPGDPPSPAAEAGIRAGDRIVAFDGQRVGSWDELVTLTRSADAGPTRMVIERGGTEMPLTVDMIQTQRPAQDDPDETERVGFLGVAPTQEYVRQGPIAVTGHMWDLTSATAQAIVAIPSRMVDVWDAAFGGGEREKDSPMGIVGASRIGGEIAAADAPATARLAQFIALLGSVNLALGLINLVPVLPLDGGHIAGALWEALRRGFAKLTRRKDPGYVDVAKALPLTYAMAAVILFMGVLLIYADIVNPVRLLE